MGLAVSSETAPNALSPASCGAGGGPPIASVPFSNDRSWCVAHAGAYDGMSGVAFKPVKPLMMFLVACWIAGFTQPFGRPCSGAGVVRSSAQFQDMVPALKTHAP